MKMVIGSIFDSKAEIFSRPIFAHAAGALLRAFEDAVNDSKSEYARHPADYTLFIVGEFDDQSGDVKAPATGKVNLGNGVQFVKADFESMKVVRDA